LVLFGVEILEEGGEVVWSFWFLDAWCCGLVLESVGDIGSKGRFDASRGASVERRHVMILVPFLASEVDYLKDVGDISLTPKTLESAGLGRIVSGYAVILFLLL
jgi:hypothetical protein